MGRQVSSIEFNAGFEAEIKRMAVEAVKKNLQPVLDGLLSECAGKPLDDVKRRVATEWAKANEGAEITDPELSQIAATLAGGERVILR